MELLPSYGGQSFRVHGCMILDRGRTKGGILGCHNGTDPSMEYV